MHDIQIKVVNPPVFQLLLANGFDPFLVVERVPQLGYEEEIFTLDETLFQGSGNALTGFFLVSIIFSYIGGVSQFSDQKAIGGFATHHMRRPTSGIRF